MSSGQSWHGAGHAKPGPAPETEQRQPARHTHPQPEPSMVKLTRGTSCVLCQQRKVRCDKNKPCANCVKAGVDCKVVPPLPPRRRKKRLQERDLIDRLRRYEALLTENGINFDAIGHELKDEGPHNEDVEDLENEFEALKTSPGASTSPSVTSHLDRPGRSIISFHREFRASEQILHDSSEEDPEDSAIYRAFDKMFSNNDGFPFVFSGRQHSTAHYHPSTIHIFQLWQTYIDNINSLLKITHVPSIQGQIISASSNLEGAPKNIEALMFGIYAMAVVSMQDPEVEKLFNRPKKEVLAQFFEGLQQALLNAGFMRTHDFISLQAYLLYLFAIRWFVDPRQVYCLTGIAVRIAQRMGLHRDPAGYGLPPFEVEQRRRLWWTIVSYDRRLGEMTGSTITALSSGGDCKLPLNVNDSDLHIDGKELPSSHNGATEMLFALTRLEIAMALTSNSNRDSTKVNPDKPSPSSSSSNSKQAAGATIRIAGHDTASYTLDGFCAHMEGTYLQHCDPTIPLHLFTLTMTRQSLSKMRIVSHLLRMHAEDHPTGLERESMFHMCVQMVEYDNVMHTSECLKPYQWFIAHHFPFPAYIFLIQELRQQSFGPLVDRTWDAIEANYKLRGLIHHINSPMHAFARHFIKAWEAHVEACIANGREAPSTPDFVTFLRERGGDARRKAREEPFDLPRMTQDVSPAQSTVVTPPPGMGPAMGSSAASSIALGPAPMQDVTDMDWSYYLVSGLQPGLEFGGDGFHGFHNFGPFAPGPGMGGSGGMY